MADLARSIAHRGGGSGDASTIQGEPVEPTAPTVAGQALVYDGTNYRAAPARVNVRDISSVTAAFLGQIVDTYDPLDATKGWKMRWNGSTWKQTADRSLLHVDVYGTRPNDSAQATATLAAINACIADAIRYGTEIRFGGYEYFVDDTIVGVTKFGGSPMDGLRFVGENAGGGAVAKTRIVWKANAIAEPVLWISGSSNHIAHIAFYANTSLAKAHSFVEIGPLIAGQTGITANRFHDCLFLGPNDVGQEVLYGVSIAAIASPGGGSNCEDTLLDHCVFQNCKNAAIYVAGGQPYNTQIINCSISNYLVPSTPSGVGLQISEPSSQVIVRGGNFTSLERAFHLTQNTQLTLDHIQSEQCKRLLDMDGLGSGADARVTIKGGRLSVFNAGVATANFTAADQRFIVGSGGGTLSVEGAAFQPSGNNQAPGIRFDMRCPSSWKSVFMPNDHVFDHTEIQAVAIGSPRNKPLVIEDCTAFGPDGTPIAYPDSPTGCRNSGRTLTFRGTNASAIVPINDEIDALYEIVATVVAKSASAASGSSRVSVTGRTVTQFQLDLEAAPGAGESVTVYWEMRRRHDAAQLQVAGKVYGFRPESGKYYRSQESEGEPGSASGFFFGALFSVPSFAVASSDRVVLSRITAAGGYQIVAHGSYGTIDASVRDGGGVYRTSPAYNFVAGDAGKPMLVIGVLDNGANLLRLYTKRLEVGSGSACTGYTAPISTTRLYWGVEVSNYYATLSDQYGLLFGTGVPSLANIQSYFDSVKTAADVVATMPGATMTHAYSIRNNRRGNAPPIVEDLVGVHPMIRFEEPAIANTETPTWSW